MSTSAISPGRAAPGAPQRHVAVLAVRELAIAFAVFLAYRAGRLVTNDSVAVATENAERVMRWQAAVNADVEMWAQGLALDVPGLIDVVNHFYVYVHFPATVAFLVWVFVRRRERYAAVRNWFVGVTMAAMAIHVAFPLAPPRMLDGFVDTLAVFGPTIYPEDHTRSVANQFAAMPSLHFGWALMVGVAMVALGMGGRRLRWLWLAHPAVTLFAIVVTANHYLLDAAVAALLALLVGAAVLAVERRTQPGTSTDDEPEPSDAPAHCSRRAQTPAATSPHSYRHPPKPPRDRRETPHSHDPHSHEPHN